MAQYELLLPKMGESVAEATIIKWTKQPGDKIELDDTILEIATDKVDSEVPSPVAGTLVKHLYNEDDVAQVGAVIAVIEIEGEDDKVELPPAVQEEKIDTDTVVENIPGIEQLPVSDRFYSPLVKNIAAQEQISFAELDTITGTGAEGRLTKDDLLNYLSKQNNGGYTEVKAKLTPPLGPVQPQAKPISSPALSVSGGDEIIEMDRMRKLIADHMVMSVSTAPHVTSFVEADVTNLVLWREKVKGSFEKRENEKITFTPIFIEAVTKAIKDFPMINV
ncbi:MAG: 2-oxo acid dehydrogenase subunit E2, partial [Pedobacter sp.]